MRKLILLLILLFFVSQNAFAKEVAVKIKPITKVTTSNVELKESDSLEFVVAEDVFVNSLPYLKKGQNVTGVVTSLEENNYLVQPAHIYIENFRTTNIKNEPVKLKGLIYKSGNSHNVLGEFVFFNYMRGGEVQIKPEKDEFTIYVEEDL